jgi:tight adherence protein B
MKEEFIVILGTLLFITVLYLSYKDIKLIDRKVVVNKWQKFPLENKLAYSLFFIGILIAIFTKIYLLIPGSIILGLIFPNLLLKKRLEKMKELKMQQWLYFLDNMTSATKAGFTLKESLAQALNNAEEPLKSDLYSSIIEINRSNQVSKVIPILKNDVKDEIGKKVVKIIELVHFLGASDFSKILTILSKSSREFHELITELKTKQTWVLNGAKIAIISPWIVLLALWTQENVRTSYQTINGQIVLFLVALLGIAGFLVMQKIGNLEIRMI